MRRTSKQIAGVEMNELAIALAYHSYRKQRDLEALQRFKNQLDTMVGRQDIAAATNGHSSGWRRGVTVVNGQPFECFWVADYMIIAAPAPLPRTGVLTRALFWMFRKLNPTR